MNQSEDGDEVVGLLSPADTHQVIHVRGSAAPRPISHFPSKAKGPAAPTSVLEPRGDAGTSPRGFPSGSIPRPRGGRSPPPGAPRAPSPHAAPRLSSLRIAIASAELPAGIPSAKPGKAAGQFHSWPRVGRSAGPWRRRLDAAGQERPGERRGAAEASPGGRFPRCPGPRRAPSLPQRPDPKAAGQPRARRAAWNAVMPRAIAWVPWSRAPCWHRRSCRQNPVSGKGRTVVYFLSLLEFGTLLPPWRGYMLVLEEGHPKMPVRPLPFPHPTQ